MTAVADESIPNIGRMLGYVLIRMSREGTLYSGPWTCPTSGIPANQHIKVDFESYVERVVNASQYSAFKDKVKFLQQLLTSLAIASYIFYVYQ